MLWATGVGSASTKSAASARKEVSWRIMEGWDWVGSFPWLQPVLKFLQCPDTAAWHLVCKSRLHPLHRLRTTIRLGKIQVAAVLRRSHSSDLTQAGSSLITGSSQQHSGDLHLNGSSVAVGQWRLGCVLWKMTLSYWRQTPMQSLFSSTTWVSRHQKG